MRRSRAHCTSAWVFNEDSGTYDPTPSSANQSNGDSHLRRPAGGLFFYMGPYEDNSGTGSPLADTVTADYGVGSFLQDVWGIPSPTTTTASVAYIVVPAIGCMNSTSRSRWPIPWVR